MQVPNCSNIPAGCSEAGCVVHGFLLLFRVKVERASDNAPGQEMDGGT